MFDHLTQIQIVAIQSLQRMGGASRKTVLNGLAKAQFDAGESAEQVEDLICFALLDHDHGLLMVTDLGRNALRDATVCGEWEAVSIRPGLVSLQQNGCDRGMVRTQTGGSLEVVLRGGTARVCDSITHGLHLAAAGQLS